jgi:hypothetical protein
MSFLDLPMNIFPPSTHNFSIYSIPDVTAGAQARETEEKEEPAAPSGRR